MWYFELYFCVFFWLLLGDDEGVQCCVEELDLMWECY